MAVLGVFGSLTSLKWGGITFHPKDEEPEIDFSGRDYEVEITGDGEAYSSAKNRKGMLKTTCQMSLTEFATFKKLQDGQFRSGTASTVNGDVLVLNAAIDGECAWKNGEVEVTFAGKIRKQ